MGSGNQQGQRGTFLLGVGAQKSGTTWLYHYLKAHPAAEMGFKKEYHVFDGLFVPECRGFRERYMEEAARASWWKKLTARNKIKALRVLRFYEDPERYFDYFSELADRPEVRLTGDITPSYAALPVEALQLIRKGLAARNLRPRVVFLMRDPVERCISAARMKLRKDEQPFNPDDETRLIRESYPSPEYQIRTRYDRTIGNLEQVFQPQEIFYGFYETLFQNETIEALCEFLGIPFENPMFEQKFNVSRTDTVIDESLRREIYDYYSDVYRFVSERFGPDLIADIWRSR